MSCILHIETSTKVCSVALSENGSLIFHKEDTNGPNHAAVCGVFVDEALSFANSHAIPVDAVAVSAGPGSYTGLRIGVSTAKGLCYAIGCKLIAIDTLKIIATSLQQDIPANAIICPLIDARRMEVYTAMFDSNLNEISPAEAKIINETSFSDINYPIYFCGSGAEKCSTVIKNPNAQFFTSVQPTANMMVSLAENAYRNNQFEDVAYYEPFYLKEFYTPQKN